jgi:hypothetical protein
MFIYLIFCIEGSFEVSINLNDYRLTKGMCHCVYARFHNAD